MEQSYKTLRQKQHSFIQQIRKTKLASFISKRRSENCKAVQQASNPVKFGQTQSKQSSNPSQILEKLTCSAFLSQPELNQLLCSAYSYFSKLSPSSQLCAEFINLTFSHILKSNRVAYQIICHWIPNPQISKYIFINQLFKQLPLHNKDTEFSSYNIHIFKVLAENVAPLTADSQFVMMSYRLLGSLMLRWSINDEVMFLISIINLLKQDISPQAVLLLVEEGMDLFATLSNKLRQPSIELNHKLLYATFIEYLFYYGEDVIETLMLSGFAQTIRLLLEDDDLTVFGLSCLENILEIAVMNNNIETLAIENCYIKLLNEKIVQFLYSKEIINKPIENNIVRCLLAATDGKGITGIVFNVEKFMPGCRNRLLQSDMSMDTLVILKRQLEKSEAQCTVVLQLMEKYRVREVLEELALSEKQDYSRQMAQLLLGLMDSERENLEKKE